jgi:hypothetical protein
MPAHAAIRSVVPMSGHASEVDTRRQVLPIACLQRELRSFVLHHVGMFDPQVTLENLQDAVLRGDRDTLAELVSDRMIWIMPSLGNGRGKREWIDASCGVTWYWFRIEVLRTVALDEVVIVEALIGQSRKATEEEASSEPVTAQGIVADIWALEGRTWRLVARHPHRIE